jgi:hypothetical protein
MASLCGNKHQINVAHGVSVVTDIPHGNGNDHAEGICLFTQGHSEPALLVVYDEADPKRLRDAQTVIADLFALSVFQT